jgi:hypothetical protein
VITGFNTDIEYDGVVYHVQTEDKGLGSPLILSLVYAGGAILASKRSRYEDLIEAGFNEEVLTERLKRQHRLICAAINAGRLEELKRMSAKSHDEAAETAVVEPLEKHAEVLVTSAAEEESSDLSVTDTEPSSVEAPANEPIAIDDTQEIPAPQSELETQSEPSSSPTDSAYTVYDSRRQSSEAEVIHAEDGAAMTILDEEQFRAGEVFKIRILLEDKSATRPKPLAGVSVSVKILGTSFRPQIYSVKTERNGIAVVSVTMPKFSSGRAAVLIRAVPKGETIELRRVIQPTG